MTKPTIYSALDQIRCCIAKPGYEQSLNSTHLQNGQVNETVVL